MGMAYGANFAIVIKEDEIKKVIPEEFGSFIDFIENDEDLCLGEFADFYNDETELNFMSSEEEKEKAKRSIQMFDSVRKTFKEKTGIELYVNRHNSEDCGDRYDGIDGVYFFLDYGDVYQLSPMAQTLRDNGVEFDMSFFVTYG